MNENMSEHVIEVDERTCRYPGCRRPAMAAEVGTGPPGPGRTHGGGPSGGRSPAVTERTSHLLGQRPNTRTVAAPGPGMRSVPSFVTLRISLCLVIKTEYDMMKL